MKSDHLTAIEYLSGADPRLKSVLAVLPDFEPAPPSIDFESTARIVLGQQLSLKAANSIFERVCDLVQDFTPSVLTAIAPEKLRQCGLSNAKVKYIRALADKCLNNPRYLTKIAELDDDAAEAEIQSNPGFGPWSSQIFLLFQLRRLDIFPYGDATLNRAIKTLYRIDPKDRSVLDGIVLNWAPYRSVACLALWCWVDKGMPELGR